MPMEAVAPTKGNLLRLQEELDFAREGHELLDHKREVLINELYRLVSEYSQQVRRVNEQLLPALELFRRAIVRLGEERVRTALGGAAKEADIVRIERSVMGIRIPTLLVEEAPAQERPGIWEGNSDLEQCYALFCAATEYLVKYTQSATAVRRLSAEIKKTQRQVNALESIFIPEYEETINFIGAALEENEREGFFRQKRVKAKLARKGRGGR